ncbi:hypothetical protein [Pseudomonas fulva]|uniref:hypothetical protein n=1 Tax=Pseudomonas fulva TaxID=47880 RepID=UPI001F11A137|nr:hypothetical protein [Pseudomonas fulva]
MPTENRSSNPEMVSVPEGFMLVERSIWTEQQVEAATACITRLKGVPGMRDCDLAMAAIDAAQCKAPDIALSDLLPAQQPHPDPIAWMVGTAFWWTKEEAERDAAETGLPIVGLGPMVDQHQGVPVALPERLPLDSEFSTYGLGKIQGWNDYHAAAAKLGPLYTHADPGEVERLRIERGRMDQALVACANERDELRKANTEFDAQVANDFKFIDDLRAQLAEAHALLRSGLSVLYSINAKLLDFHAAKPEQWCGYLDDALGGTKHQISEVEAALSASAEPSAPTWSCQSCQLEQPTERPCDACSGKTELIPVKS